MPSLILPPVRADGTTIQETNGVLSSLVSSRAILTGGASAGSGDGTFAPVMHRAAGNATEVQVQSVAPFAFTAKNLRAILNSNQTATQNTVLTLRKNGVNTALTITFVAAAAAGTVYTDLVNTVAIAAGDKLSWVMNTGGGLNSVPFTASLEALAA